MSHESSHELNWIYMSWVELNQVINLTHSWLDSLEFFMINQVKSIFNLTWLEKLIYNSIHFIYYHFYLIYYIKMKILNSKINRKSIHKYLIKIKSNVKEDFIIIFIKNNSKINLTLNYWINKNKYIFLNNLFISYISIQLFSKIL